MSPPGTDGSPRDSSATLLKSMTNALSRIKSKERDGGDTGTSAIDELQELARLANMASNVTLPGMGHNSAPGGDSGAATVRGVDRGGFTDQLRRDHGDRLLTPQVCMHVCMCAQACTFLV